MLSILITSACSGIITHITFDNPPTHICVQRTKNKKKHFPTFLLSHITYNEYVVDHYGYSTVKSKNMTIADHIDNPISGCS